MGKCVTEVREFGARDEGVWGLEVTAFVARQFSVFEMSYDVSLWCSACPAKLITERKSER